MTEDGEHCIKLPPNFKHHILESNAPSIYKFMIPITAVCLVIVAVLIIPAIRRIMNKAREVRDLSDDLLIPSSYKFVLLIVSYPVVVVLSKFVILISPLNVFSMEFITHCYEAICLYCFCRILIMLLGTHKAAIQILESGEPTKFWAVLPFACCCKPCCKAKKFRRQDFRVIYQLVIQYTILTPLLSFLELVGGIQDNEGYLKAVNFISVLSSFVCIYGLFALLRVSSWVLHEYKAHGKFFTIKGAVLGIILPQFIIGYINMHRPEESVYTEEVFHEAWSSFVAVLILTPLSFYFVKFFDAEDCEAARTIPLKKTKEHFMDNLSQDEIDKHLTMQFKTQSSERDDGQLQSQSQSPIMTDANASTTITVNNSNNDINQ
jgi:hypothetical protein